MCEYSLWRIKRILKEIYNCELRLNIKSQSYKANRYRKCKLYDLVNIDTGEIIETGVTIKAFNKVFKEEGIPLYDKKSKSKNKW